LLYTGAARYAENVERYFGVFGREQVHCIVFDDFVRDTGAAYRRTLEFLGVDPTFQAELDPRRANERMRMLAVRQICELTPELVRRIQFRTMKLHDGPATPAPLAAETAARLRQLFAEDVARLGAVLGRDLGAWTRGEAVAPVPPVAPKVPGGDRLAGVRALRSFPPELRAKHDKVETLERKFARWQSLRVPELSLEQLPYNPLWPAWFAGERTRLAAALGPRTLRIEHFGSTAVAGLSSKNIVDIAIGLDGPPGPEIASALAAAGYENYGNSPLDPETVWFWRLLSDRAFVLHVAASDRLWIDEQVDMREYLRTHPEERDHYREQKRRLAEEKAEDLLHYSLRKLAITVDMVDRARTWRGAAVSPRPRA
jgi:GrpB-like predicted nucleotidyltransferase (UPF0157 family)